MRCDIQETKITFDHTNKEVYVYTSRRAIFLSLIKRNPDYIRAEHRCGGYRLLYPADRVRKPEMLLKVENGGEEKLLEWLSPEEQQVRAAASERLKDAHRAYLS